MVVLSVQLTSTTDLHGSDCNLAPELNLNFVKQGHYALKHCRAPPNINVDYPQQKWEKKRKYRILYDFIVWFLKGFFLWYLLLANTIFLFVFNCCWIVLKTLYTYYLLGNENKHIVCIYLHYSDHIRLIGLMGFNFHLPDLCLHHIYSTTWPLVNGFWRLSERRWNWLSNKVWKSRSCCVGLTCAFVAPGGNGLVQIEGKQISDSSSSSRRTGLPHCECVGSAGVVSVLWCPLWRLPCPRCSGEEGLL